MGAFAGALFLVGRSAQRLASGGGMSIVHLCLQAAHSRYTVIGTFIPGASVLYGLPVRW